MLMMQVLMPMRDDILRDIQVPAMMKLPVWYKVRPCTLYRPLCCTLTCITSIYNKYLKIYINIVYISYYIDQRAHYDDFVQDRGACLEQNRRGCERFDRQD